MEPHYLKFYSAWGGFNSSIGAKQEFVLELAPRKAKNTSKYLKKDIKNDKDKT